jgi:hypothetical protein
VLEIGWYMPVYHTGTFFLNFIPVLINTSIYLFQFSDGISLFCFYEVDRNF